jgi:ubiquinone/menaquinone biosynthesis C-methylase UbiE
VLRRGDALSLDEVTASYDGVLLALVLHHLVSASVDDTVANIRRAIEEAARVLEPGGRLTIVESCVPQSAFAIERRLFHLLHRLASTRLMQHPPTLQLPQQLISTLLRERFGHVEVRRIATGRLLLQFGHKWPTILTPARPYLFTAR